jgi:hypothetical protein
VLLNISKFTNSADLSSAFSDHLGNTYRVVNSRAQPRGGGVVGLQPPPPKPPKPKVKKDRFCEHVGIKVLRDFSFSRNQPLKSADDQYITILKSKFKKLKNKKTGLCD